MSVDVTDADVDDTTTPTTPSADTLPEGDTTFTPPPGPTVSGATTFDVTNTTTPSADTLPEGDTTFTPPPGVTVIGASLSDTKRPGQAVEGEISSGGEFADGEAYIYQYGDLTDSFSYTSKHYTLALIPPGVVDGETIDRDVTTEIIFTTEAGGVTSAEPSGPLTVYHAAFKSLSVDVFDVDGNPVSGDKVVVGNQAATTNTAGTATLDSAGAVTVSALNQTLSKGVDLEQTQAVQFQYAGIEGSVQTPDGEPIAGKPVLLLDADGEAIAVDYTTGDGSYSFPEVGPDSDRYVRVEPYFRPATTRGEGKTSIKQFPATILLRGAVEDPTEVKQDDLKSISIEVVDFDNGDPIKSLQAQVGEFDVQTEANGRVRGLVEPGRYDDEEVPVTVGEGRRYRQRKFVVDAADPVVGELLLEREVRSTQA